MLNDLPEDGNISDRIERIVHVVPPPNALSETREGRSTVEGDENEDGEDREDDDLEEGPDTSGATGPIDNEDVSSRGKTMCPTLNLLLLAEEMVEMTKRRRLQSGMVVVLAILYCWRGCDRLLHAAMNKKSSITNNLF